jgi:hypothetical protein
MWVDKDDLFADDKIREFKNSNPDLETHIRSTLLAKSPYPSASTRSQLLYHHASSSMSSDGNQDLAYEYPVGAIADSPIVTVLTGKTPDSAVMTTRAGK